MNKSQIYSVLALFLFSVWIGGCSKNEEPPVIEEPQDTVTDASNILFDTLTIAQVQQFLQGKWKIEQHCWHSGYSGTNCIEVNKEYIEFVGTDTLRFIKDSVVNDYEILEWGKSKGESKEMYLTVNYQWGYPWILPLEESNFSFYGIFDDKMSIGGHGGGTDLSQSWSIIREI